MCTLAIYFKVFPQHPVVIAANRDEFLERPATPPTTLANDPHTVGGKDLQAGGTWLGINSYGLVAGLLNRASPAGPNPALRSRGLLCMDALRYAYVADAENHLRGCRGSDYNNFNLLVASRDDAMVAYNRGGELEIARLAPGPHLLTNLDVNDFECPRISRAWSQFASLADEPGLDTDPERLRMRLGEMLADHSTQLDPRSGRPNSLCLHLDSYGTRSSSVIILGKARADVKHWFAPGPPCTTAYAPAMVPESALEPGGHGRDRETSNRDRA